MTPDQDPHRREARARAARPLLALLALLAIGCSRSDDGGGGSAQTLTTPGGVRARYASRAGDRVEALEVTDASGARVLSAAACTVSPSLEAWLDGAPPRKLELDGAVIRVLGETRFLSGIGAMFDAPAASCAIRGATVEIPTPAANPSMPEMRAESVEFEFERTEGGAEHGKLAAAGVGAPARVEWTKTPDTVTASCDAKGLALDAWQPLAAALLPGARISGRGDARFELSLGPGGRASLVGDAALDRVGLVDRTGAMVLVDPFVALAGRLEVDLAKPLVLMEKFRLASSFALLEGNGALRAGGGAFAGDLAAHFGIDFERAGALTAAPWAGALAALGLSGSIDARVNPGAESGIHLSVSGDRVSAKFGATDVLVGTELTLDAELRIDEKLTAVEVQDAFGSFAFGDVSFSGAWRGRDDFHATFELESDLRHVTGFAARVFGLPGLGAGGDAEISITIGATKERWSASARMKGEDLGGRFEHSVPGGAELYLFEGAPLDVSLELAAPSIGAPADAWTGRLEATAGRATIGVDVIDAFRLEAALEHGVATVARAGGKLPDGGTIDGSGSIALFGPDAGRTRARFAVKDVLPRFTLQEVAAAIAPVFAPAGGAPIVKTDVRMTAELEVEGQGDGLGAIRSTASGQGRASFSAGAISGSPLADALAPDLTGTTGARKLGATDGKLTIDHGTLRIDPLRLEVNGREFVLRGATAPGGALDFSLDAATLFDAPFVENHGKGWPANLFGVRGTIGAPRVRVPDVAAWRRLAEEGALDRAVREFDGP